jgi:hypothetical protein
MSDSVEELRKHCADMEATFKRRGPTCGQQTARALSILVEVMDVVADTTANPDWKTWSMEDAREWAREALSKAAEALRG